MLAPFRNAIYLAALKWKQGEARALGTINGAIKGEILPLFDVPPAGEFDHETQRVLEPTEHIRSFGSRLYKNWGGRPVFVDAARVDDERHRAGLGAHPLTELLERARLAGGLACPVTSPGRSALYQSAVSRFLESRPNLPICIRIDGQRLENPSFAGELRLLLFELSCSANRAVLVIDFGALEVGEPGSFAELLATRLNDLPHLHEWLNVAVLFTSFPERMTFKAGQAKRYARSDWAIYNALHGIRSKVLRMPIYGDYAVEYPGTFLSKRVPAVAQFRYTTPSDYLIEKGVSTRQPNGYKAIFPVAAALIAEPEFNGPSFSAGDAFIHRLATIGGNTGNASSWRWAATDHHITLTWSGIRMLLGLGAVEPEALPEATQLLLV